MHRLRAPGGCPWDREQSHRSLRRYLIEEACELIDAIDSGDDESLRDELGDVLLQVLFHAELATERDAFDIDDVCATLAAKLRRRHPHVFADAEAETAADVSRNWEAIKAVERAEHAEAKPRGTLGSLPRLLPALARAHALGSKAAKVGFDWPDAAACRGKIDEELAEVDAAAATNDPRALADEIGDVLFAVTNYARLSGVHAEGALSETLERFRCRFEDMEAELRRRGLAVSDCSAEELNTEWERIKRARDDATTRS